MSDEIAKPKREKKVSGPLIGTMACYVCGDRVPVKEQSGGLAKVDCPWCGCQLYARGELADKKIRERMTPAVAPVSADPPATTPPKKKETSAAPKKSGSLMEGL